MPQGRSRHMGRLAVIAVLALLMFHGASVRDAIGSSLASLEALASVARVVDGDTFDAVVIAVYKDRYLSLNGSSIRVRLADINAPELRTSEGEAARAALKSLLEGRRVYLDIDDLYIYDRYGRVVAVAYLPINSTHALNVNLWLVINGYASIADYPNEFNPSAWSLYIRLPSTAEATATVTVTVTTTVVRVVTMPITTTVTAVAPAPTITQTVVATVTRTERITIPTTVTVTTANPTTAVIGVTTVTVSTEGGSEPPWILVVLVPLIFIAAVAAFVRAFRRR